MKIKKVFCASLVAVMTMGSISGVNAATHTKTFTSGDNAYTYTITTNQYKNWYNYEEQFIIKCADFVE